MTGFSALPTSEHDAAQDDSQFTGESRILGPKRLRLPALTVGLLGVQMMWSLEMAYASPYLLSLGLSKSVTSTVFLAGPISGLIMQPLIGVLADHSKSRFGRRRPFMLIGSLITVSGMLLLGYTRSFASIFTTYGSTANDRLTILLAVLSVFLIDFSINAVQGVDRALIVDVLPPAEQASGNAWAAKMLGIGSVFGFFFGQVDLTGVLPFEGATELEVLSAMASLLLLTTQGLTAFCVKEKVLVSSSHGKSSFRAEFLEIWRNMRTLPPIIQRICIIQFFSWIGWFPVLFYLTAYIGDLHIRGSALPSLASDAELTAETDEGTRLGSRALLFHSLLVLAANFLLPLVVTKPRKRRSSEAGTADGFFEARRKGWTEKARIHLATMWAASHALFFVCMEATLLTSSVWGNTILVTLIGLSWAVTQWAPFSLLGEAILSESPTAADADDTGSIRLLDRRTDADGPRHAEGYQDAEEEPFMLGEDEGEEDEEQNRRSSHESFSEEEEESNRSDDGEEAHANGGQDDGFYTPKTSIQYDVQNARPNGTGNGHARSASIMSNSGARLSRADVAVSNGRGNGHRNGLDSNSGGADRGLAAKSGIILGIHNIYVVIPQFLSSAFSSIVFAIVDPGKSVPHHARPGAPVGTQPTVNQTLATTLGNATVDALGSLSLSAKQEDVAVGSTGANSYAIIFRVGGLAAAVACVLTYRLSRELQRR